MSVLEWVLPLSWPVWAGLVISIVVSALWAGGRQVAYRLTSARAEQAGRPNPTVARPSRQPERPKSAKERYREEHYLFYLNDDERPRFEALGEDEKRKTLSADTAKAKRARDWARRAQGYGMALSPAKLQEFESLPLPQKKRCVSAQERKLSLENIQAERACREAAERASREWYAQRAQEARQRKRVVTKGLHAGVQVRPPKDADDFETICAEWATNCGVRVKRTEKGPDGGLDVIGEDFAGQCKFHPSNKVSAPDVQQLAGAALQAKKNKKVFFHYGPGYTQAAVEAARATGVELWEFDPDAQTFRRILN